MPDHNATALALDAALDDWTDLHAATDWAAAAARDVVEGLRGRSGFDVVFDDLGEELNDDVLDSIETIVGAAYLGHERTVRGRRTELVAEIIRVSGDRAREYQRLAGELRDRLATVEAERDRALSECTRLENALDDAADIAWNTRPPALMPADEGRLFMLGAWNVAGQIDRLR